MLVSLTVMVHFLGDEGVHVHVLLFDCPLGGWKPVLRMFVIEQISCSCGPLARAEKKPRNCTWVA